MLLPQSARKSPKSLPGQDVEFIRGAITPAQVESHRPSHTNAILIQSRGQDNPTICTRYSSGAPENLRSVGTMAYPGLCQPPFYDNLPSLLKKEMRGQHNKSCY